MQAGEPSEGLLASSSSPELLAAQRRIAELEAQNAQLASDAAHLAELEVENKRLLEDAENLLIAVNIWRWIY